MLSFPSKWVFCLRLAIIVPRQKSIQQCYLFNNISISHFGSFVCLLAPIFHFFAKYSVLFVLLIELAEDLNNLFQVLQAHRAIINFKFNLSLYLSYIVYCIFLGTLKCCVWSWPIHLDFALFFEFESITTIFTEQFVIGVFMG